MGLCVVGAWVCVVRCEANASLLAHVLPVACWSLRRAIPYRFSSATETLCMDGCASSKNRLLRRVRRSISSRLVHAGVRPARALVLTLFRTCPHRSVVAGGGAPDRPHLANASAPALDNSVKGVPSVLCLWFGCWELGRWYSSLSELRESRTV